MKLTALLPLLLSLAPVAQAFDVNNPLPNWVDKNRETPVQPFAEKIERAAPPEGFRIPAEYEPVGAVVVSWAGYTDMLRGIAQAVTGPGRARLYATQAPASLPGVPASSYQALKIPVDTVWVRDYGPFGISAPGKLGIVDSVYRHYQYRRNDDSMPVNLGKAIGIEVFGVKLILDGGNIMFDSKGNLFMTKRTYIWNSNYSQEQVDALLKAQFKVKNVYTFDYAGYPGEPADGTGHIDMFQKLLNDHTVLISVADAEPFKSAAEKAIAWYKSHTAGDGQPYKIITVKGWQDNGAWYTYTNSLIVNNTVLMPSYSGSATEQKAIDAYKAGMPNVTVVPINSDDSITAGGSIHCTTQTIPQGANKFKPSEFLDMTPVTDYTEVLPELDSLTGLKNF